MLQSHVGKEEHWQEVDGGNNDPTNDLEQQQQQPDNEVRRYSQNNMQYDAHQPIIFGV